jgi:hypothetical protein
MLKRRQKTGIAALIVGVVFGCLPVQSQEPSPSTGEPRQPEQTQAQPAQQSPSSNQQSAAPPPIIVNVHPAPKTEEEAAQERHERHEKSELDRRLVDLTAELAYFTAGLFAATIALFNATAGLAFFGWRQSKDMKASIVVAKVAADAAKESADVAKDTLVATNRPWISVGISIGSDLTYDGQGDARVIINFVLKNVGKSPAANVQIDAEIVPIFGDTRPFQKAIADRNKIRPAGLGNLGVTLFPDEIQTHSHNLPISRASIDTHVKKMAADFGDDAAKKMGLTFLATLVGCVDYKFTFAEGVDVHVATDGPAQ